MRPNIRSLVLTGLLASAGLGTVFNAAAQTPAPTTAAAEARSPAGLRFDPAAREARQQKQLEVVKAKLRITPQQEGAWKAYTDGLRPTAKPERFDRVAFAKLTTPQRIEKKREMRARHIADANRRDAAAESFYAALTPAQQQTFDALPPQRMGKHGPGHHHAEGQGHEHWGGRTVAASGEGQPAR